MTTAFLSKSRDSAQYAWAEHLIWMEGGEPVEPSQKERIRPGVILTTLLAATAFLIAWGISRSGWTQARLLDPVLLSMLLGLAAGNFIAGTHLLPGASFTVRKLLPLGIILLGARMDFMEALRIGAPGMLMSLGVVTMSVVLLSWMGRLLGLDRKLALLLGVGTGICGGTAIVAIAPLLKAGDRHVLVSVGLVTFIGLAAMLLLPLASGWLGLTETQFGLLAGLTIHQTPQVIAAGFAVGEEAGQIATVAKLSRVCLLAPAAVGIGWWMSRREGAENAVRRPWYRLVPLFAIGFLLVALAKTFGLFPQVSLNWDGTSADFESSIALKVMSSFFLAAGMVGVGFQTRLSQVRETGWRPLVASVTASILLTAVVVTAVRAFF
ncbi:MAG: putative sulfate exporter family transporter [Verrucomicrobiales bacterium]|nr:putative sulfate exporter family transporter [Verrucomicrobiales bacterium]